MAGIDLYSVGNPLCTVASCGTGGATAGPQAGLTWAWLGGAGTGVETATAGQTVTIPSGATATLKFQLWIGGVNTPFTDVLNVKVNGANVQTFTEPATAETVYTERSINLTPFANGTPSSILFEYVGVGGTANNSNFSLDSISLESCTAASSVTVSGRVQTSGGQGLQRTTVKLTDGSGTRSVITSSFGYFSFDNVAFNQTVSITASSKGRTFASQNVPVTTTNVSNVVFTPQ